MPFIRGLLFMSTTAMTLAVTAAEKSNHIKWKLGSVLWRGGSVISTGYNRVRNDPAIVEDHKYYHCTVHAEADAIRNAGNPAGAKLFVARITKGGNLGLARPCPRCMETIRQSGIKKVYYTNELGEWTFFRIWP